MDKPENTEKRPAAQAFPCGMDCGTSFVCGKRRLAFERIGVPGHQSDGLTDFGFEAILPLMETGYAAGYAAGREGIAIQLVHAIPQTRWAA